MRGGLTPKLTDLRVLVLICRSLPTGLRQVAGCREGAVTRLGPAVTSRPVTVLSAPGPAAASDKAAR